MASLHEQKLPPDGQGKDNPADGATAEVFVFPTTVAQRRFWLLDQLQPGNPMFNIPLAARLNGRLKVELLEQAVNNLIQRHEILRTSFSVLDGELMQLIHPPQTIELDRYDISGFPENERETRITQLMLEEGDRSFSLTSGLLLRGGLIKVREEEHVVMLTMHHISADGWSNGVLIRELAQTYTHLLGGPELPELPLQYADFAQWQQEWLQSPMAEEQRRFWMDRFQGSMPVLNQPTDRPRSSSSRNPGTIHTLLLPKPLTESLKQLCQNENITTFMLFFAVYTILLYRYTGNTDLIVGSPAANRGQTELEDLIGLFSNPLVLRTDLSGNPTFREFLDRVRTLAVDAMAHQAYPFELLADEVKIDQTRAGGQWIQAYFIYQKAFMVPQQMPELILNPLRSISPGATFEWTLGVLERAEGTRLQLEYNTDFFDESTIDRFLHHFQNVLESAAEWLNRRIDELPILTSSEKKHFLADRNESSVKFPGNRTVCDLFEDQAGKTPQAPAIQDGPIQVTYAELHAQINRLTQKVVSMGIGREKRVVLLTDRWSFESVTALLSIMNAGACCVIIDASWTPEHISALISGKGFSAGFARKDIALKHPVEGLEWMDFNAGGSEDTVIPSKARIDQPACMRFESHQTGPSNGMIFSHHALLNGALAVARELGIGASDRIALGFTGLKGMEQILASLTSGASTVIKSPEQPIDGSIFTWSHKQRISILSLSIAQWQQTALKIPANFAIAADDLRLVVTDGKTLAKAPWMFWREHLPSKVRWLHSYSVYAHSAPVAWIEPLKASHPNMNDGWRVSIGRPSANAQIYLLDKNLQPVSVGIMGRVFVGGEGLGAAKTSDADKIGDLFVRDPFSGHINARLFRTDDFGRFLPNQQIEWVAESDDLAKTNGWRFELREIQMVLMEHPAIWDVKLVIAESAGTIAYVVSKLPIPPKAAEVILFCRQRLLNYMVPAGVVVLSGFPHTPDGEIDIQALPVPDKTSETLTVEYTPPRTETEIKLADIWTNLLHLEKVSIRDSFFALGGHSLLAARLFFRIELEFGRRLPLAALISKPTIEQLATLLDTQGDSSSGWPSLVPIQKQVSEPAFFCVHGAGGNILIYRELAKHLAPFTAFYGLQSQGLDRKSHCLTTIEDMASHYVDEIQSVQPAGPYYIGGYCMGGQIAYEMAKILRLQGHEVALVALLDSYNTHVIWEKRSLLRRLSILQQKLTFHGSNIARLNFKELIGYFKEKCRLAAELVQGKTLATLALLRNKVVGHESDSSTEAYIQEINHQALRDYQPSPCDGKVTLFKPERNYDTYSDPKMGWGDLALGGIDIVELPVNPHAMLIDPFVKFLAAELGKRIAPSARGEESKPD